MWGRPPRPAEDPAPLHAPTQPARRGLTRRAGLPMSGHSGLRLAVSVERRDPRRLAHSALREHAACLSHDRPLSNRTGHETRTLVSAARGATDVHYLLRDPSFGGYPYSGDLPDL